MSFACSSEYKEGGLVLRHPNFLSDRKMLSLVVAKVDDVFKAFQKFLYFLQVFV